MKGHHGFSLYSDLVRCLAGLPQYGRWLRESPSGKTFIAYLIQTMATDHAFEEQQKLDGSEEKAS